MRVSAAILALALMGRCSPRAVGPAEAASYDLAVVAQDDRCRVYRFETPRSVSFFAVCESGTPAGVEQ